nr:transmembrane protein 154 [Meriones unguiculatus]
MALGGWCRKQAVFSNDDRTPWNTASTSTKSDNETAEGVSTNIPYTLKITIKVTGESYVKARMAGLSAVVARRSCINKMPALLRGPSLLLLSVGILTTSLGSRSSLQGLHHFLKISRTPLLQVSTDPKEQETGNVRVGGRPGLGSILSAGEPADMTLPCAALVLALGLALGHSGHGNDEDWEHSGQGVAEGENPNEGTTSASAVATTEVLAENTNSTLTADPPGQLEFLLMVALPLAALVILVSVVLMAAYFRSKKPEREPSSQGSQSALQTCELGGENLKVPIFEEDTPSVMEIEMEELDKWMNSMNRKADYECLPTLKEEKEPNLGPSENES